jgi:hypothetical protein
MRASAFDIGFLGCIEFIKVIAVENMCPTANG